jgi:hypothetical protein
MLEQNIPWCFGVRIGGHWGRQRPILLRSVETLKRQTRDRGRILLERIGKRHSLEPTFFHEECGGTIFAGTSPPRN